MKNQDRAKTPSWLKRIQEGSWEPEILISGIVLYGLFQIPSLLDQLNHYLENYSYQLFAGGLNSTTTSILKASVRWLIFGFISHLFFRSIWAAYVGLSYIYPEGVKVERLKYIKLYERSFRREVDFKSQIERLEKICSSIFAVSFLVFMWVVGLSFAILLFAGLTGAIFFSFPTYLPYFGKIIDPIVFTLLTISIIDLISLGGFKRIPYLRKLYYPLHYLISLITLSFLYRNIYYSFASNEKRWKVSVFLFMFFFITLYGALPGDTRLLEDRMLAPDFSYSKALNNKHYRNLAGGKYSDKIHISSDVVDQQLLEVFVVHKTTYEEYHIYPLCDFEQKIKVDSLDRNKIKMDCLNQFYHLELNGKEVKESAFFVHNAEAQQDGLKYYIDIAHLGKGHHKIILSLNYYNIEENMNSRYKVARVNFYKSSPKIRGKSCPKSGD